MSIIKARPAGKTVRQPLDVNSRKASARRRPAWWDRRMRACRAAAEAGMSTAEYAVGTIAACGFAAVLYKIVTSGPVRSALTAVIEKALHASF
ncbi:DUF4244 domain-containing protein [Actinacidiphila paucisporea]|uniref:DUF4244 domain-containing protein n=1 Tax=Actinacidiphila paucisporea TaxID=310782 RepID=A0A1M7QK26_9ACTN|nr:DUF4244 domain-containing protein [Actinacidiphila paucisporea]SHN31516.1 Protein of unknown function [Actinacidiphila paucisporea]